MITFCMVSFHLSFQKAVCLGVCLLNYLSSILLALSGLHYWLSLLRDVAVAGCHVLKAVYLADSRFWLRIVAGCHVLRAVYLAGSRFWSPQLRQITRYFLLIAGGRQRIQGYRSHRQSSQILCFRHVLQGDIDLLIIVTNYLKVSILFCIFMILV